MDMHVCILTLSLFSVSVFSTHLDLNEKSLWSGDGKTVKFSSEEPSLEEELHSLSIPSSVIPLTTSEEDESLEDELDDVGQQRERPQEASEEDDGNSDAYVTTLVPTVLTEEDTRVDEPTERGPAEPTKENDLVVTSVMDAEESTTTLPSAVGGRRSAEVENGKAESKRITTFDSEENESESESESQSEEDDNWKTFVEEDSPTGKVDDGGSDEKSVAQMTGTKSNVEKPDKTKDELKEALHDSDLFTRDSRQPKGEVNSKKEEEMLEFLVRLSENPKDWAKISQILGKLDYDATTRLKSALQMEALNGHPKSHKFHGTHASKQYKAITMNKFPANIPIIRENSVIKTVPKSAAHPLKENNKTQQENAVAEPSKTEEKSSAIKSRLPWEMKTQMSKYKEESGTHGNHQDFGPFDAQLHSYPHSRDPINPIAVDVPGTGNFNNNKFPNEKQGFIAVSVYKPTKQNYQKIDIAAQKTNSFPVEYPLPPASPSEKSAKGFAVEKPVTFVGSEATRGIPNGSDIEDTGTKTPHPTSKEGKNKNKNKNNKNKNKNKQKNPKKGKHGEGQQQHQSKSLRKPAKLKHNKAKMESDEIEAQLIALSKMEQKLRQHLLQKEKLRQRLRTEQHNHRMPRSSSYM